MSKPDTQRRSSFTIWWRRAVTCITRPRAAAGYTQKKKMQREIAAGNIWFGKTGEGVPRIKRFLKSSKVGLTPETFVASR